MPSTISLKPAEVPRPEIGGAPKTSTRASGTSRASRSRIFAAMASPPSAWSRRSWNGLKMMNTLL